jgi:thiol-disulfide isomerase/thioredoxin
MRAMRMGVARCAAIALGLLLALCACTNSDATGTSGFVSGDGAAVQVAVAKRGEPVDLKGTTLDGDTLDVASLRGRTVVLNVWGSWCAPCRKEAPALVAADKELASKNVAFVGINTRDDSSAQAKAFEQTYGITYPSLVDDGGELLIALRGAVPPKAIPSTLILDPQGRIAARFNGAISQQTLVDLVTDASKP